MQFGSVSDFAYGLFLPAKPSSCSPRIILFAREIANYIVPYLGSCSCSSSSCICCGWTWIAHMCRRVTKMIILCLGACLPSDLGDWVDYKCLPCNCHDDDDDDAGGRTDSCLVFVSSRETMAWKMMSSLLLVGKNVLFSIEDKVLLRLHIYIFFPVLVLWGSLWVSVCYQGKASSSSALLKQTAAPPL